MIFNLSFSVVLGAKPLGERGVPTAALTAYARWEQPATLEGAVARGETSPQQENY
jgi:hypothetical protein